MRPSGNLAEPVRGRLDTDGRLISADPLLLRLHFHCGGYEGGPLAVPQLANICRLSKQLGMNLSRSVRAADDDSIIDMWVETRLHRGSDSTNMDISIVDWNESQAPLAHEQSSGRQRDFDKLAGLGTIRTDTSLRIVSVSLPSDLEAGMLTIGQSLLDVFDILPPSKHGALVEAIAERQPIRNQRVRMNIGEKRLFGLTGHPLIDTAGLYSGYRFTLEIDNTVDNQSNSSSDRGNLISDSLFGAQLGPALRQPLGKIIANAETIGSQLEGPLRGDYANYAKDIASAGRHLLDLVNDLSDLEAIERPNFKVVADEIDLVDLAHRAAGLLAVKSADHQIRVDLPDKEIKVPALGEFRRVLQILVNLLGNAIRYSPDGSVIKIIVNNDGDRASISIRDQGDGIDEKDQPKVFEKFERLGRSGDGGSGLGLFISRRLATAMEGELFVKSVAGKGATFTLALPARKP